MTSILLNSPTSFFGNTQSRLRKHTLLFRYVAEVNILLGIWYLQWRMFHSLNWHALWLAIPLFLVEIYSYFGGLLFVIGLWRPLERHTQSLDVMTPSMPIAEYPTTDVFITCYNEPIEIIAQTTRAALKLKYAIDKLRVYVLDDGNSPEVRQLIEQINAADQQSRPLQKRREQLRQKLNDHKIQLHQLGLMEDAVPLLPQSSQSLAAPSLTSLIQSQQQAITDEIASLDRALENLDRCRYIARPKPAGQPHHAKAGNINYALFCGHTEGEFVLTLDADHILKPQFLQRVVPYFFTFNLELGKYISNRIAFVQTPQDFHNLPKGDPFGHSAHLFYGPIQQGKDGLNAAFYTGTNAILRREALMSVGIKRFSRKLRRNQEYIDQFELIGALATNSITEDMNTAMHLHANGWQSVYHNELLAEGLAPDDLGSTLKQRLRWAQGTIQVLMLDNPLTLKGLSIWQRLQYFQTMYSYFAGFAT
jgi:cellulose synthase (UDP-forming)